MKGVSNEKLISLFLACSILLCSQTARAMSTECVATRTTYTAFSSEEEWRAAVKTQIAEELREKGIYNVDIYFEDEPMPHNDVNDYKNVVVARGMAYASGFAGNQPPGGVRFSNPEGGSIYYTTSGGPEVTVSATLSNVSGTGSIGVSVNIPLGQRTDPLGLGGSVAGYTVNIPSGNYYKLWVNVGYTVIKHVTYRWVWLNDMDGWQWVEYDSGIHKTFFNVDFDKVVVG